MRPPSSNTTASTAVRRVLAGSGAGMTGKPDVTNHPPPVRRGTPARLTSAPKVWLRPTCLPPPKFWPDFFGEPMFPKLPPNPCEAGLLRLSFMFLKADDSFFTDCVAPPCAPPPPPPVAARLRIIAAALEAARFVSIKGVCGEPPPPPDDAFFAPAAGDLPFAAAAGFFAGGAGFFVASLFSVAFLAIGVPLVRAMLPH